MSTRRGLSLTERSSTSGASGLSGFTGASGWDIGRFGFGLFEHVVEDFKNAMLGRRVPFSRDATTQAFGVNRGEHPLAHGETSESVAGENLTEEVDERFVADVNVEPRHLVGFDDGCEMLEVRHEAGGLSGNA